MDVAVVRLWKVTDRTNGLIWNLNGSQERRSRKGKGCWSAHHSRHRTGPTSSAPKSSRKHNFVTTTTPCAGCQRYPGECAKISGFGDSLVGMMQYLAQKDCQGRWCGWQGPGVLLQLPLQRWHPAWVLGAIQGHHWQPKIISGRAGKALASSLPLSLNRATIRPASANNFSQFMFLLRKFSEIFVLYSLRPANSEHIWTNSYVNRVCAQCSSHGTSFQALRAVDAQLQPWLHAKLPALTLRCSRNNHPAVPSPQKWSSVS